MEMVLSDSVIQDRVYAPVPCVADMGNSDGYKVRGIYMQGPGVTRKTAQLKLEKIRRRQEEQLRYYERMRHKRGSTNGRP